MIIMDEQRAIEKTASELKTIQNRLNKLLKQKQSAESQEIANLKSIISNFRSQIDDASGELHSKEYQVLDLESQMGDKDKIITTLKNQRKILVEEIKKIRNINLLNVYEIAGENNSRKNIVLPGGYLKFRKDGKWGIKDNRGKIIIENKYNEIGSYLSDFIGFLYGETEIVKEVPPYDYNIPIAAKFKYANKEGYAFDVGGVDCYIPILPEKERWFVPGEYYYMIISNVVNQFQEIEITEVTFENTQIKHHLHQY
jgi:hypothetical protein